MSRDPTRRPTEVLGHDSRAFSTQRIKWKIACDLAKSEEHSLPSPCARCPSCALVLGLVHGPTPLSLVAAPLPPRPPLPLPLPPRPLLTLLLLLLVLRRRLLLPKVLRLRRRRWRGWAWRLTGHVTWRHGQRHPSPRQVSDPKQETKSCPHCRLATRRDGTGLTLSAPPPPPPPRGPGPPMAPPSAA
jgi:hypothetical protein